MEFNFALANDIQAIPQFLTSLAIGLLIGLERERNPSAKAGLRTFALVSLFGTLMAMLANQSDTSWLLAVGLLAVAAMIISVYRNPNSENADPGTTTVAALLVCYALGALIWFGMSTLAIMLAVATTTLLYFKPELRGITQRLKRTDLVSVLQFSVLTFVVLPILPNQSYGPYGAFNPYQAWMMVVLISGMSLAGYVALQWAGQRFGAPLLGVFGGLVSSTATTLLYAKQSKVSEEMVHLSAIVILIASQMVLVTLMLICVVVAPSLLRELLPPLALGLICGLAVTLYNWKSLSTSKDLPLPQTSNPTELHTALGFGVLFVLVLLCSAWLNDVVGDKGMYMVSLVAGLTDVHPITLSSMRLFNLEKLTPHAAASAIVIAYLANMIFKTILVATIGGWHLGRHVLAGFAAMAAGTAIGLLMF